MDSFDLTSLPADYRPETVVSCKDEGYSAMFLLEVQIVKCMLADVSQDINCCRRRVCAAAAAAAVAAVAAV